MSSSWQPVRQQWGVAVKRFCLLLWLVLFLPGAALAGDAPQVLADIGAAVDAGNQAAFERLVDVDGILGQALDVFLAEAARPEGALPPMLAIMLSQAAGQPAARNLLLREARAFVLNGISSGAFAGKKLNNAQQQGLLAPLFALASIGRKEIRGVGTPVGDGAGGWFLPFSVHDYGNDNDYAVIGRFTPRDNNLRLTGIENLEQLFAQIKKEVLAAASLRE